MNFKYFLFFSAVFTLHSEVIYESSFRRGAWDASEWEIVKSARSEHLGKWVQHDDFITNQVPPEVTASTPLASHKKTFSAMLLKKTFSGDVTISAELGFTSRMAPGIILLDRPLRRGKAMPELPEHLEVILFDHGLNVWSHYFENGIQKWRKEASFFTRNSFAPNKKHTLTVKIYTKNGKRMIEVYGNDKKASRCESEKLSGNFRVGIVASEGINFFHNFKVSVP